MKHITLLLFVAIMAKSCDKNIQLSQQEEQQLLDKMYTEIQNLAGSEQCTNAGDWAFTAIGAKACGGPMGYIAYSLNTDTGTFLKKVEKYTAEQKEFNKKWSVISDCSLPPEPSGVRCANGKPELIY